MLSTKDLVFKERLVKKLTERYIRLYMVEEIVPRNVIKLKLLASIRIYPVVNISRIMRYKELVKGQRVKEPKLVEVDRVEKWEVEKILNKRKVSRVMKYLVQQKKFMTENDIWENEKNLENTKELVNKLKRRIKAKVR